MLQAGLQLIKTLASQVDQRHAADGTSSAQSMVHTDAVSGERYLKLPLPEPAMLRTLAEQLLRVLPSQPPQ